MPFICWSYWNAVSVFEGVRHWREGHNKLWQMSLPERPARPCARVRDPLISKGRRILYLLWRKPIAHDYHVIVQASAYYMDVPPVRCPFQDGKIIYWKQGTPRWQRGSIPEFKSPPNSEIYCYSVSFYRLLSTLMMVPSCSAVAMAQILVICPRSWWKSENVFFSVIDE